MESRRVEQSGERGVSDSPTLRFSVSLSYAVAATWPLSCSCAASLPWGKKTTFSAS